MMMQYEFEQMQDCITALFDCFERVQLDGQPIEQSLRKLIEQNISFARKMVELSEKFDQLYSRQSQQLSEEIHRAVRRLYSLVPGHWREGTDVVEMLEIVAEELQKRNGSGANSRQTTNMRDSKRERNKSQSESNLPMARPSRKPSSGKNINLKEALTLKRSLELEEQSIRQLFDGMHKMIVDSELPLPQAERYKYQKHYAQDDQAAGSILTLVKGNIDNNSANLQRLRALVGTVSDDVLKYLRKGSSSAGRLGLYLAQIEKREEVFSYTVSKILQSFRSLDNELQSKSDIRGSLHNLEELLNKLFDIYPSADLLKDIHLTSPESKQNKIQEYIGNCKEVQVNIKPKQSKEAKKQQIELFRVGVRLNQWLRKMSEALRYKKTVEAREIDKWLDGLRDNLASIHDARPSMQKDIQAEINAFEEEHRRLQADLEIREADLKAQHNKQLGKYEKAIKGYEADLQQLAAELSKGEDKHAKLLKKLENEKQEVFKLRTQKDALNSTIAGLQKELDQLRSTIKTDQKEQSKQSKIARSEQELITREKERIEEQLRRLARSLEDKELSVEQERSIYKSKIKLIEEREEEIKQENGRLKQELEIMIGDNRVLKERVEHLGQLYEEKIKESEEFIEEFRRHEEELNERELELREARVEITSLKESVDQLDQELTAKSEDNQKLAQEKTKAEDNARKFKELGRLNEEDIQVLKEEIQKVKSAYFQAEEQLANLREAYDLVSEEKLVLTQAKCKYSEMLEDIEGDLDEHKRFRDRSEEAIRLANEELRLKEKELDELGKHLESYKEDKKELARYKKENSELRSSLSTAELQLATLRHDMQNASLLHEAATNQDIKDLRVQNSKFQLEMESLRIELKHSKQAIERDRTVFERERGLLQQKITDLKGLLNEKENLASRLKLARHFESLQGSANHTTN